MRKSIMSKLVLLNSFILPIFVSPITSCSQNNKIDWGDTDSLELITNTICLRPGDSTLIRVMVHPYKMRYNDAVWEIIETPYDGITVKGGLVSVPFFAGVTEPKKLTIKASIREKPSIFALQDLYIVPPNGSSNFIGFVDNQVSYFDYQYKTHTVNIVKKDQYHYETEDYIDAFVGVGSFKPEPFQSLINFQSIAVGPDWQYMTFCLRNNGTSTHGISWNDYQDNDITNCIPDFEVTNPTVLFEIIDVHFLSDPNVCLSIKFSLWQDPNTQSNPGIIMYSPDEGNPHTLINESTAVYSTKIYCPAIERDKKQFGYLLSIHCSRQKFEYSDFVFTFERASGIDDEIWNAFSFVTNEKLVIRQADHFRYYLIDFYYTFDTTKLIHTADYWDYELKPILNMYVWDRLDTTRLVCSWTLWVDWC